MNQTLQVELYGSSHVSVDGKEYSSLFIGQRAKAGSATAKGIDIMKLSCDPDVFKSLPAEGYPQLVTLEVELRKAAGGKLGQHAVRATLARNNAPAKATA